MVEITEIDPLDMAEILGQVGGFWDLILFFWPFFFVAASQGAPTLKPRNFRKSAVRAKEKIASVGPALLQNFSIASTTSDPPRTTFRDEQEEELSTWERRGSASHHQKVKWNARILVVRANCRVITRNPRTFSLTQTKHT